MIQLYTNTFSEKVLFYSILIKHNLRYSSIQSICIYCCVLVYTEIQQQQHHTHLWLGTRVETYSVSPIAIGRHLINPLCAVVLYVSVAPRKFLVLPLFLSLCTRIYTVHEVHNIRIILRTDSSEIFCYCGLHSGRQPSFVGTFLGI